MGKKVRIRQGKKHRVKSHVYVLTETNNTRFFSVLLSLVTQAFNKSSNVLVRSSGQLYFRSIAELPLNDKAFKQSYL